MRTPTAVAHNAIVGIQANLPHRVRIDLQGSRGASVADDRRVVEAKSLHSSAFRAAARTTSSSHAEADIVTVARTNATAAGGEIPVSIGTANTGTVAIVPTTSTDKVKALVFERVGVARIGLGVIGDPLVGITDHVHASVGTGPRRVTTHGSALVHAISAGNGIVIVAVVAFLGIPHIAPRPCVGMLFLFIPPPRIHLMPFLIMYVLQVVDRRHWAVAR